MRQLKSDQRLLIVGEKQIFDDIRRLTRDDLSILNQRKQSLGEREVDIVHVLSWIMHNTIESTRKGLGMWSEQGLIFETEQKPQDTIIGEKSDVESFYGRTLRESTVLEQALASKDFHCKRTGCRPNKGKINQIIGRCNELGSGYTVMRIGMDEECERELEREVEEEEEEETYTRKMIAHKEEGWDFNSIFVA